MGIGVWIFKRLFRHPCVVGLAHVRWESFDVKADEFLVAGLLRSKHLHEHRSVNRGLLRALHCQQTRPALQGVKLVHQAIALSSPRG